MRTVVADAGPLNYLVLTGNVELLPRLFGRVLIPAVVREELRHMRTPAQVREFIATLPQWLEIVPPVEPESVDQELPPLGAGECAVIAAGLERAASLLLMDDRKGVAVARQFGLNVTGTIGVLDLAARRGWVDLASAFERLKTTNFHYRQGLLDNLLARSG